MKEVKTAAKIFAIGITLFIGVALNFPFNPIRAQYPENIYWFAAMGIYDFIALVLLLKYKIIEVK